MKTSVYLLLFVQFLLVSAIFAQPKGPQGPDDDDEPAEAGVATSLPEGVVNLTWENFASNVESGAWIIYFTAPWCEFCNDVPPETYARGDAKVGVVDISIERGVAEHYAVKTVPQVKFLQNGYVAREVEPVRNIEELTDGNFKDKATEGSKWFIMFYAPWCTHCTTVKPVFEEAAKQLEGIINIGRIDATQQTALAQQFEVNSYPAWRFYSDGIISSYTGGRELAHFTWWGKEMSKDLVKTISNAVEYRAMLENTVPTFVMVHGDRSKEGVESDLGKYEGAARRTFSKTNGAYAICSTAECKALVGANSDDDLPVVYAQYDGQAVRLPKPEKEKEILEFMETNAREILPEMTGNNYKEIAEQGKLVVVAVVSTEDKKKAEPYLAMFKELALKHREDFGFCWLDGEYWHEYIDVQYGVDVKSLPHFFIMDDSSDTFYEERDVKTQAQIEEFFATIKAGRAKLKLKKEFERPQSKPPLTDIIMNRIVAVRDSAKRYFEYTAPLLVILGVVLGRSLGGGNSKAKKPKKV
eukprot:GFYU01005594.1.p1 GENE.GFYU01005594.1~~GFYU01005594.1.p1  ORF type:complete len:526 (-),score=223.62 GFYU01005594.1:246-1823(-)